MGRIDKKDVARLEGFERSERRLLNGRFYNAHVGGQFPAERTKHLWVGINKSKFALAVEMPLRRVERARGRPTAAHLDESLRSQAAEHSVKDAPIAPRVKDVVKRVAKARRFALRKGNFP